MSGLVWYWYCLAHNFAEPRLCVHKALLESLSYWAQLLLVLL